MAKQQYSDSWLEDFSYVLTAEAMRRTRSDYRYDIFAGSKLLAWLWLAIVSIIGGALGGMMVSGALWDRLVQLPLWLAAAVGSGIAIHRSTVAMSGTPLAFLAAWCFSWALLLGACAMCGAQLDGPQWAYGTAGGVGFLIGIVQGAYEPEDIESHEALFAVAMLTAPLGACAAVWIDRNILAEPGTLLAASVTGTVAGVIFLTPVMAVLFKQQDNIKGLKRVGSMLLHRDDTAAEAIAVLDSAIRLAPNDASLFGRRALAHALCGHLEDAEGDWARQTALAPKGSSADISRGWLQLRRGRPSEAARSFERARSKAKRDPSALIGLGVALLEAGDASGALEAFGRIAGSRHDALSLTHLAEAQLAWGDAQSAADTATDAIEELDSVFGRTWLVRAEAKAALGDLDAAARDFNQAWHSADEEGIQERAMAGLDAIGRPIDEDGPRRES